jgi:hypothetical protein
VLSKASSTSAAPGISPRNPFSSVFCLGLAGRGGGGGRAFATTGKEPELGTEGELELKNSQVKVVLATGVVFIVSCCCCAVAVVSAAVVDVLGVVPPAPSCIFVRVEFIIE